MNFHTMKRKELQALCKNHKIPANLTNLEMANRLASLLEVDKEKPKTQRVNSVKSCLKNLDDLGDIDEKNSDDKLAKKVRFSPEDQTFEFEKTNPREMRLARRKSVVIAEDKINTGEKVDESVDVDNQVKSTRIRGSRGRKPEQADVVEAKLLPKKKAEEIDWSKKASRKRTSGVADCEVQPLVVTRRQKATKNTASEAKPVTRRSGRIVERPDESASLTEQVEIVKLPKRKARSDCPVNQEMEKAPTRCLRRNISKDACAKAVEEVKGQGNGTSRVTRNTRQQKGDIGLNETVSAAESAPVVEKASTGAEEVKEQGSEKARVTCKTLQQKGGIRLNETVSATESAVVERASTRYLRRNTSKHAGGKAFEEAKEWGNTKGRAPRTTRQQKGDTVLNETVSATESADVVEQGQQRRSTRVAIKRCSLEPGELNGKKSDAHVQERGVALKSKQSRKQENSSRPGKSDEQTRCADKRKLSTKKHDEGLQTNVEVAPLAKFTESEKISEAENSEIYSVCEAVDIQNRLCNESSALEDNQDNNQSLHQTTPPILLLKECELTNAEEKAELINESSTTNNASTKQPENAVFSSNQKGVLLELYSSDGQITEGDEDEPDTDKEEENKEAEILDGVSLGDVEVVLLPSIGFQSSPCGPMSTVSRSSSEGSRTELEITVSKADNGIKFDPALTSTSIDAFTGISLPECDAEAVLVPSIGFQSSPCGVSLADAEAVLVPSIGFQSSPCGAPLTVSRSFTEGSKTELEKTVSKADNCVKIDPALTSTVIDTFTGISLPECESGSQGIYHTQLETAIPSSLIVESDPDNNNSVEGSPVKNTESEEHTLCAETILSNEEVQLNWTSSILDSATAKENQSGDALEERNTLDFYNLEGQVSEEESTVHGLGLESYQSLHEFQSWLDKPAASLETSTLASNESVNRQADTCTDHLGAHESGKNTGDIQEAEGVTSTPMADERSEGIDTYISDGSDDPAECKRSHKQGLEEESNSPMTIHEQTYDVASLFQLDNAEKDSVVKSNGLEGRNITKVSDVRLNNDHENDAVLADRNLEVYEEKGENVGCNQEAEGVTPTATVDELSEGIDAYISDRSYDPAEFEKRHKQGLKEESTSQLAVRQEAIGMIASFFQLENIERNSEETYDIASLFQLEKAEGDSVVTSNEREGRNVAEVSDAQLNDNHGDEIFADRKLEVNEEEGESCRETHEISGRVNESAVSMEEAVCIGSTTKVHKVSSPPSYYNNKLELVAGLKKLEELTCIDYEDKSPAQLSTFSLEEDAFMDEARESDPRNLTEIYSGCTDEKMHTLQQVNTEPISMHDSRHTDHSESDSEISSEDESSEEKDAAVTPNDHLLAPYDLEHADANNNYEITQEVSGEVACLLEDYMVFASKATQDGVTPNSYSPEPNPADLSHPMHQEEYEGNDKNEAAPNVLEGSEEKLVLPSSVEEANPSDENVKSDDSRATVEAIAPSPEALCPVDELYSTKHIEPEEDFLGLAILERISEQAEEEGSNEISGEIAHTDNDSGLHDTDDNKECMEKVLLTPDPQVVDNKVYKEVPIHNGHSSEDSENVLLSSGGLKGSPLKEAERLTSLAKVDEIFGVVDSFTSDRIDDCAESEGSHKQGLTKESNLQLSGHEDVHCGNLVEASAERPVFVHESSDNEDIELTSYETALFKGDGNFSDKTGTLEYRTSERSLLTSKMDGSEKKEEIFSMEQVAGDEIYKQGFQSSEYTLLASVVCDTDESMQQNYALPNGDFLEPEQCKIFEVVTGVIDRVLEDENAPTDEANKDVSVGLMKQDEGLVGEICSIAETLEGDNGRIEPPVTASFPEMSSITPDDESKNADVKGISNEDVFKGSGQEGLIRSVVANLTAVNMEIDALGGSVQILTPLPEPSYPVEEMDATKHTCEAEDVNIHENREKEFEFAGLETDNDTFGCEADELNHTTSETGSTILSSLVCASKVQEEAAVPNRHSMGICQVELDVSEKVDQCTALEGITPAVYNGELSKVEHEDTGLPEHSRTSELVTGTCEHLREDEAPVSSENEIGPTVGSLEFCIGESEVQPCVPHLKMHETVIDDQYKSENMEGISKEDEIMPRQEMRPLNDEITPDVYDEDLSKVEHEDTSIPGTFDSLEDDNASVIQPMSDTLEDLKEDEVPASSEEEIKSTGKNLECSNGELEVWACELHPEMNKTMLYDQYKSENLKGISKEDEIMPQQEMKPLNDEILPDFYDEDLSENEHTSIPEHSRTSEHVSGTFEHLEDDSASVIQPMSDMLKNLKEDEVSASSEEEIKSTGGNLECSIGEFEINTIMIYDQYHFENVKGTSKEDEIMPQQKMKPLNDEIRDAKLGKVEKSSKKPASATNQKKRSILIHGTPRRPIKIADMKENSTAQLKRDHLANATALKPLAGRKALGELSRWRP